MNVTSRLVLLFSVAFAVSAALAAEPFPSTYQVPVNAPVLIQGATVLTGTGERLDGADVLISNGRIQAVGKGLTAPPDSHVIDAHGKWVTPGIIDIHSHLGVYASPAVKGLDDGNEATNPVTSNVWAEHSVWPQDPGFETALEGGVTTMQILPGSANLIGGRSMILKNVQATTYQAMKFPGAAYGLKMACGENPKRVYGSRHQAPSTRMGNVAGYRQAFADAQDYQQQWDKYNRELGEYNKKKAERADGAAKKSKDKDAAPEKELTPPTPPKRDLKLETLAEVLKGNIRVHMHCYRSDEMATMLDVADEFGFKITAFHHAVEAYKIADRLAEKGVCAAMWADWWGFKMEAYDGIQENLAIVDYPEHSCAIVHSDSADGIQRLNQEAGKAMAHGRRVGLVVPPERAIKWLTLNPAKSLGLDDRIGTLEAGKGADVVIWNGNPFSVYALAEQVFIDGALTFDRAHPQATPRSDFLLGRHIAESPL
ncbi:MAG TPA: amidohydrolase [Steroidobacteraceae bacterium]|jgi:imidazolonepropionase-like amidohydrolase|nr:amidohydrolase [Steroidobacteraceae bacterium]